MARRLQFGAFGAPFPPSDMCVENVMACEALGYDFVAFGDHMQGTAPRAIWTPDLVPGARIRKDMDQWFDTFHLIAAASQRTSRIRMGIAAVDSQRRSPAVLAQSIITLDHLAKGRTFFAFGSGSHMNSGPYGGERQQPLARLEESLRVIRALWASQGRPVNRDSKFWPLRDAVFALPLCEDRAPKIYVAGGSPRIERLIGELADGWVTILPGGVDASPQRFADTVGRIKEIAVRHGRDPEALDFIGMPLVITGKNEEEIRRCFASPIIQWTAITATPSAETWVRWGHDHPLGNDFVFARDFTVTRYSREEALAACAKVPAEVIRKVLLCGDAEQLAEQIKAYVDAGMTQIILAAYSAYANPASAAEFPRLMSEVMVRLGARPLNLGDVARSGTVLG